MRSLADKDRLESFCAALGKQVRGPGRIYQIARPRLELSGLLAPAPHRLDAEIQLYRLLGEQAPNPHGRFNSLLRELVSLEHALDHRLAKHTPVNHANPR